MASFKKLTDKREMKEVQVADASDKFKQERAARGAEYIERGAGVNQGDQAKQTAKEMEARAKREEARMSAAGKAKAAALRSQAAKLRGEK